MASGAEMVLKALGIDPEEFIGLARGMGETLNEFKSQLDRIENKLDAMKEGTDNDPDPRSGTDARK